jgi:hypothetical protein
MGRGLSKRLTEYDFPDLPQDFIEYMKKEGRRQGITPAELVEELKGWQKAFASEVSEEDREFVREELAWLAEWIRSKYPKLNFGDIRRFLKEMVPLSV